MCERPKVDAMWGALVAARTIGTDVALTYDQDHAIIRTRTLSDY